jgi:hypothetical protein
VCRASPETAPDARKGASRAGQQVVHDLVRELTAQISRHAVKDPRRGWLLAAGANPVTRHSLDRQISLWLLKA